METHATHSSSSSGFLPRRTTWWAISAIVFFLMGFVTAFLIWHNMGGGVWRSEVGIREAELREPRRLALFVESCGGNPGVTLLSETDTEVEVKVISSSTPFKGGGDCLDIVDVHLRAPLGDRSVIDSHTGQTVNVSVIN